MAEGTRPHETFNTAGYTEIPQLQEAQHTLREFATFATEDILSYSDCDVIVPLNGSIIPLYYAYEYLIEHHPDQLENFTQRLFYMRDVKDAEGHISEVYFDRQFANTCELYLFDDIADELHVVGALSEMCNSVVVHAPVEKEHTRDYMADATKPVALHTQVTTANKWIANTCGMNEGAKDGSVEQQAYLSTLQRFSRKGYFKELDNSMSVEEKIAFFEGLLLDGFDRHDDLFILCQVMEQAKIEKRYDNLMNLAPLVVPAIVDHIKRQNNLAQAQDPHYHEFTA